MPILRTTWKLFLPRNYRYVWFGGTMKQETGGHVPWIEPAAESLLNDFPAGVAGGIARPTLRPPQVQEPIQYDSSETDEEKRARLAGTALEIPIVREGLQFDFSKLSGVGAIETSYWKRKPLILLQGAVGLAVLLLLLIAMGATRRLGIAIVAVVIALIAASLTEGLMGRLCATALAASGAALVLGLLPYAVSRIRMSALRTVSPAKKGPSPPSEPPQAAGLDSSTGTEPAARQ